MEIPEYFPNVELDEFVILPNHLHGIIIITHDNHDVGAGLAPALNKINNRATARVALTIGYIVGLFKSIAVNECLKLFKKNNRRMGKLWQRNYYEHIIRNNDELKIREYITRTYLKNICY